jgi:uncharacterized small protein (DUF1192 family)
MVEPTPAKFISFFRLIDACHDAGCPVCRCLAAETRQYLETLLYERVNDPVTRARLYTSWGFCNWHAWMLRETSDPAFGSAILCEDLLRVLMRRFERSAGHDATRRPGLLNRLRALLGRARVPGIVQAHRRRVQCPACSQLDGAEERYLETALRSIQDPQFDRAYRQSQGLCLPHALRALEIGPGGAVVHELLARTLPKWAELRRDLAGFVGKHDYRNREPYTEAEGTAYLRAVEALTGSPGLFPSDMRRETGSARRGAAAPLEPIGRHESTETDAGFEHAKLELRVKELTEQLSEASSRAAALHYRLSQVAEDRNTLELNLSGERAANQLGQRVIAELRAEIERLRAEQSRIGDGATGRGDGA